MNRRVVIAALALWLAGAGCGRPPAGPPSTPETIGSVKRNVRVGLAVRVASVELQTRGEWDIEAASGRLRVANGAAMRCAITPEAVVVTVSGAGEARDAELVRFVPRGSDTALVMAGAPYRGRFEARRDAGALTVVETVDVEAYLRGVVPFEIGNPGPAAQAAVEAQAVAARTYTLTRFGQFDAQGFDVFADERDQVYKGESRRDPVADRAVDATRGLVLEASGTLVQAYYSSTCGGHTSWIENVWPKPAAPYLRGHRDANSDGPSWCAASRHFRWTEAWSGAELETTLRSTLPRVLQLPASSPIGGSLVDLRVIERDASGRVLDLEVQTTAGTWHVKGDAIRWALKPRDRTILRSIMFELDVERQAGAVVRVVARGGGNGHGVGMCQMGAIGMAKAGYDVAAILDHYYPTTRLRRAW